MGKILCEKQELLTNNCYTCLVKNLGQTASAGHESSVTAMADLHSAFTMTAYVLHHYTETK